MSEHRRHMCPEDDLDLVCDPGRPWCEECLEDWPCPDAPAPSPGDGEPDAPVECPAYEDGRHRSTESLIPASYSACRCGYRGPYNPDRFA